MGCSELLVPRPCPYGGFSLLNTDNTVTPSDFAHPDFVDFTPIFRPSQARLEPRGDLGRQRLGTIDFDIILFRFSPLASANATTTVPHLASLYCCADWRALLCGAAVANPPPPTLQVLLAAEQHLHPHDAIFLANGDMVVATWAPGRISYWKLLPAVDEVADM